MNKEQRKFSKVIKSRRRRERAMNALKGPNGVKLPFMVALAIRKDRYLNREKKEESRVKARLERKNKK